MAGNLKDNSRKIKNNPPCALRTILSSLKKYRFLGVLTAVTILVEAAMQIEIPTVMSNLIDFGIMSRSQEAVQYYGLQLLIFAAIAMIAGVVSGICCAHSSAGLVKIYVTTCFHAYKV